MENGMIQILRFIIISLAAGWLSWFLGRIVLNGIKTGALHHTNATAVCKRQRNPFGFWALTSLFALFIIILLTVWVLVLMDALKN
jgi:hypothetical protein